MSKPYNRTIIPRAKELRKNMTAQEKHLWYDYLSKLTVRFQRQKVIGSYIVDFYCHAHALVIEVDGSQHYTETGLAHDNERTAYLKCLNLTVIRVTNLEIDKQFAAVCQTIARYISNT